MKLKVTIGLLLVALELNAAEPMVIRGEVSFAETGIANVSEYGTTRIIQFGVMASSPYFIFARRYDELSNKGQKPVLVEMEGNLMQSTSTIDILYLEYPRVLSLTQGACNETPNQSLQSDAAKRRR